MASFSTIRTLVRLLAAIALVGLPFLGAEAGSAPAGSEVKFQGQLVWGTNDDPKKHPQFKELDSGNQKILKNFKWKNYLVTNRKNFTLKPGQQKQVKMSDKCTIVAKHRGAAEDQENKRDPQTIAVSLLGEGKLVTRHTKPVCEGHTIVLGGDLKNGTAWFVLLKRIPENSGK
jgi:hypothetical protein